jgi:hypothetical protein
MANGSLKPISQVKVGDKVLATDPMTGKTTPRRVTKAHVNRDTDLTDVTVTVVGKRPLAEPARAKRVSGPRMALTGLAASAVLAAGTTTVLYTTDHHPFWDQTVKVWVDAADLTVGHELRTADGTLAVVTAVRSYTGARTMHDLTVDTAHTYQVVAGTTPVLVHNCGDDIYQAGGKHGKTARNTSRGPNSAEPTNGQVALDNSVQVKDTSPRRVGVDKDNGEIVVLDRTRREPCGCTETDGANDVWHGHVRAWGDLHPDMQTALRSAGLVDRKGRIK